MTESLLERQPVLAEMAGCLERARGGRGGAYFVIGEAGLGKTSILEAAVQLAGSGFEVIEGRGYPMETAIPFGLAAQVFDGLGDDPAGAIPPGPDGGPVADPSVPFLQTLRSLQSRTGPPLLLALDDLHCADTDSLRLIPFLVRRLADQPVVLIGALRPWPPEASDAAWRLEASGHATVRKLESLGPDSAVTLLERSTGGPVSTEVRERALRLCGGNPLLIEQLADAIGRGDGVPETGYRLKPPAEHLLLARFAGLDHAGMQLARCAGVIGDRFRTDIALAAAGLDPGDEQAALDALCRSGLVVDSGQGRMRFAHPLFRQVLYEDMPVAVRRRLHGQVFRLLAAAGLDELAADQATKADLVGDDEAATVMERVGRAAAESGAIATAAVNLGSAVRFRGSRCDPGLLSAYAHSLLALARAGEAAAVGRQLLALPDLAWADRVATLRMLGHASYLTGTTDLGDRRMETAIGLAMENDPAAAIRPLLDHASITWMARGPAAALPKAARAADLATGSDPHLLEAAVALRGHLAVECGDPAAMEAVDAVGRRLDRGDVEDLFDPAELTWPAAAVYGYAHCERYAERFDRSQRALDLAREALERAGEANGIATVTLFIAKLKLWRGQLRPALDEAARAEEFSELTPVALPFISLVRAEALVHIGDFEASERYRVEADGMASDPGLWLIRLWSGLVHGIRLLRQGDARASEEFLAVEELADRVGLREPSSQPWAGNAVPAHLVAGRRADAERVTETLERTASAHPSRWPRAIAALSRARIHEHDGEPEPAEAAFLKAIGLLEGVDLPLERAETLAAFGSFTRRRGRTVEARRPLAEAVALAERAGAGHLATTAHSELKLAGGRRHRAIEERDLITAAELRVAREAIAGHTNAQIAGRLHLSTNTVQSHLKRIYSKLGIRSRRELAGIDLREHTGER